MPNWQVNGVYANSKFIQEKPRPQATNHALQLRVPHVVVARAGLRLRNFIASLKWAHKTPSDEVGRCQTQPAQERRNLTMTVITRSANSLCTKRRLALRPKSFRRPPPWVMGRRGKRLEKEGGGKGGKRERGKREGEKGGKGEGREGGGEGGRGKR